MAITHRTGKILGGGSIATFNLSFGAGDGPGVGDIVLVMVSCWGSGVTLPATCSDNQGNAAYVRDVVADDGGAPPVVKTAIYRGVATNSSGTFTVSVTGSANAYYSGAAISVSGLDASPLDQTAASNTGNATPAETPNTSTTTQASELQIGCMAVDGAHTIAIDDANNNPVWTEEYDEEAFTDCPGAGASRYLIATGTYHAGWDLDAGDNFAAVTATYKVGVAGGPALSVSLGEPVIGSSVF